MVFGEKLKSLRRQNGLTQEDLAQKVFVTRTAVSKWETGGGYPSIDSLKLIAELFGTTIDELISDEDVQNCRFKEKQVARRFYWASAACVAAAFVFAVLVLALGQTLFCIGTAVFAEAYLILSVFAVPRYKRRERKKIFSVLLHVIVGVFVAVALITTFV